MRRIAYWWRMNWDWLFVTAAVIALALPISGLLGAIEDTIRHIRIGY